MKIWIVITNLQGGGAERAMINLAEALGRKGHAVRIVLLENRIEHSLPDGVRVEPLVAANRISTGWIGKRIAAWRLRRWADRQPPEERADLVISTLPFADEVVRLARLENAWHRIANTLSAEIDALERSPRKARRRLERYRRLYDGQNIIAVSEGVASDLRERLGFTQARIVTIYNGFDLEEIRRRASLPEPGLPREPYIVHAGRFARQKRHDLLLDAYALAELPHRLVLLTKPSEELERMIAARGLSGRVTIAGFCENPFPWYANAAVLVLSSDYEGFPNVLVEALACGTPVVSTDCRSGPSEILQGELSRFLSPCGDVEALARNMVAASQYDGSLGVLIAEKFSEKSTLELFECLASYSQGQQPPRSEKLSDFS